MTATVLLYGYGNPGRLDDGLGPALARELAARGPGAGITIETGYQLQIEDAALVAEHDVVVFADADTACEAPYELRRLEPRREMAFTTHSVSPEALLGLAHEHFGCRTEGWVLGIRGYSFNEFGETLSPGARRNLAAASDFVHRALSDGSVARNAVRTGRKGEDHA